MNKIAIVMGSYGRKNLLFRTLRSLWDKTPNNTYKFILVDNSFQDIQLRKDILDLQLHDKKYHIDQLVLLGQNLGKPYSWNLGYFISMNLCEINQDEFPDYFVFCDSDLEFTDNWLVNMVDVYQTYEDLPLGCLSAYLNKCGEFKVQDYSSNVIQGRRHPPGCCWMISREVFEEVGLFDSKVKIRGVDTSYSKRLWAAGFKNACVFPRSLVLHTGEGQRTWDLKTGDSIYHKN